MVECAALEMRFTGNRNVGSNPTLSASHPAEISKMLEGNCANAGTVPAVTCSGYLLIGITLVNPTERGMRTQVGYAIEQGLRRQV